MRGNIHYQSYIVSYFAHILVFISVIIIVMLQLHVAHIFVAALMQTVNSSDITRQEQRYEYDRFSEYRISYYKWMLQKRWFRRQLRTKYSYTVYDR